MTTWKKLLEHKSSL